MRWIGLWVVLVGCSGGTFEVTADTAVGDFAVRYIKVPVSDPVCPDQLAECLGEIEAIESECITPAEGEPGFIGPTGEMMLGQ